MIHLAYVADLVVLKGFGSATNQLSTVNYLNDGSLLLI